MRCKKRTRFLKTWILFVIFLISAGGCAGPSTQVLQQETSVRPYETQEEEIPVLEEANPFYLQETLHVLSAAPRVFGSDQEAVAAASIKNLLEDYGYEVRLQPVLSAGSGVPVDSLTGSNVIAVKKAMSPGADIVMVSVHHDTVADSPGAASSAAGVAAFLESARLVSRFPSDTELWFVSFTGSGKGEEGAFRFLDSIPEYARDRIIGAVSLGVMGIGEENTMIFDSESGGSTVLGDLLQNHGARMLSKPWTYRKNTQSISRFFAGAQIPSVTLTQAYPAFEVDTALDLPEFVDVEQVSATVDVLAQTLAQIMRTDTPSLLAKSRFQNAEADGAYMQPKEIAFLFGAGLYENQLQIGRKGILASSNRDEAGAILNQYQYSMKWFGVDQKMVTSFYYKNEGLESISIDADGAGAEFEDMKQRITAYYGYPVEEGTNPSGTEYYWVDPVYHKSIALIPHTGAYDLEIEEYDTPVTALGTYRLDGSAVEEAAGRDSRVDRLLELVKQVFLPEDQEKIAAIRFETDGVGNRKSSLQPDDPGRVLLTLDLDDLFWEDGTWRDYEMVLQLLAKEYGHLLLTKEETEYLDGYRQQAGADATAHEFAEAFARFVLLRRSDSADPALGYFETVEFFNNLRSRVRDQLGLYHEQQKEG